MRDLLAPRRGRSPRDRENVHQRGPRMASAARAVHSRPDRPVRRETLGPATGLGGSRAGLGMARWGRHRLAADSVEALRATGSFGTVELSDLGRAFPSARRARRAIRDLQASGLLRLERFRRGRRKVTAVTLTPKGARLMERSVDPREKGDERAQIYARGPARPAQVLHDIAVYRAACQETRRIRAGGRRVRRVVTERQLQAQAARLMHAARARGSDSSAARTATAEKLGLTLVDGKLAFPDLRLETLPRDGSADREDWVDLELVTPDYRDASMRAKSRAGFTVYRVDGAGRVTRSSGKGR